MRTFMLVTATLLLLSSTSGVAAGVPPWKFGMTKAEVTSFKQFGPYKTFRNGDLETVNGRFRGHKENIQFFFTRGRLHRIGVYLGEGTDTKKADAMAARAYATLQNDYGNVITVPKIIKARGSDPLDAHAIGIAAVVNAWLTGRSEMFPVKQPSDMNVTASVIDYQKHFAVAIFFQSKR